MQIKENEAGSRDSIIVSTSIKGIVTNIFLVIFKMLVGFTSNSIAIILDAVNNLSDVMSSIITIVGTKLANKLPDKKHPLGYGRVEYLSAMAVSILVMYAGITAFIESVKKIIAPEEPNYTPQSLIIIAVAVLVKIMLGLYVRKKGKQVDSTALIASGSDALSDAVLSFSVLTSAIIFVKIGISLEPYVGVLISIFIMRAGFEMLTETISDILGQRSDKELSKKIKSILASENSVHGAYDLFLYNYGPNKNYGSVHLALPDTMTIEQFDVLGRRLERKVYNATGVILTGIGAYSYNTKDDDAARFRNEIVKIVLAHDFAIQLHGFYVDMVKKDVRFDVVLNFETEPHDGLNMIRKDLEAAYPNYKFSITADVDVSD